MRAHDERLYKVPLVSAGKMAASTFIYVIGVSDNPVKIGFADNVERRVLSLQTGCPDELRVLAKVPVPKRVAQRVEEDVHFALRDHHRRGEWFNVSAAAAVEMIEREAKRIIGSGLLAQNWREDVGRLRSMGKISDWALEAILAFPDSTKRAEMHAAIHQAAGADGWAIFDFSVLQGRSLLQALAHSPSKLERAEASLAAAVNAMAAVYAADREDALLEAIG